MFRFIVAAGVVASLVIPVAVAQSPGPAPGAARAVPSSAQAEVREAVLPQLLSEVRQLRLVLHRQAADSARIQLMVNRLNIQETRVSRLARDLEQVREGLARLPEEQAQIAEQLKHLESALPQAADQDRRELEEMMRQLRRRLEGTKADEQRLRAREAELDSSYSSEQVQWIEISRRLEELERSLERP